MGKKVVPELQRVQALWSRKYGQWLDERRPYVRVELYKEVKALEAQIQEIKKGQVKK